VIWWVFAAGGRSRAWIGGVAVAVAVAACSILSRGQCLVWKDDITLFGHATRVTAPYAMSWHQLGKGYQVAGRNYEAVQSFRRSIEIDPGQVPTYVDTVYSLLALGDYPTAERVIARGLEIDPEYAGLWAVRGAIHAGRSEWDAAVEALERAVALDPKGSRAAFDLAEVLLRQGRYAEAAEMFRETVRRRPDLALGWERLAWVLALAPEPAARNPDEARAAVEQALRRSSDAMLRRTLAVALAAGGDFRAATEMAEAASEKARAEGRGELAGRLMEDVRGYREGLLPGFESSLTALGWGGGSATETGE
jgi:tetratricopeptide (TPR) repeat protein